MKNFENYQNNAEVSANNLLTHTYFLCEVEKGQFYKVIATSNDYRDIVQGLFTRNGCCRFNYFVIVNFDGVLYHFHQGDKIDLSNPICWIERDGTNYHLKDYEYIVEQTNN